MFIDLNDVLWYNEIVINLTNFFEFVLKIKERRNKHGRQTKKKQG